MMQTANTLPGRVGQTERRPTNVSRHSWWACAPLVQPHLMITGLLLAMGLGASQARGQSSSLLGDPAKRRPLTMMNSSFTYQAPAEPKTWKINDFVTVLEEKEIGRAHV